VRRLGNTHAKVLISDDRYIIVTSFNWLSFRGDPKRTFRDERGTLVSRAEYVEQQSKSWLARFAEATT
jgi:phosphatidylserine/phosphatidylglycerophosphate/cardiolipin synthase-like enzyme